MEKIIPEKKEMKSPPHGEKGPSKEEKTLYIKSLISKGGVESPTPWVAAMLAFPQEKISHYTTDDDFKVHTMCV